MSSEGKSILRSLALFIKILMNNECCTKGSRENTALYIQQAGDFFCVHRNFDEKGSSKVLIK